MIWKFRGKQLAFPHPLIMGIVNITPDSFSDGGRFLNPDDAVQHAIALVEEGADILDLGAESTRPGASEVSEKEELERLMPVLEKLRQVTSLPISIDTTKPEVARLCLETGADIINDVSGLLCSGAPLADFVRQYEAGLILMHRRGNPRTMQTMIHYQELISDVLVELEWSLRQAESHGIARHQIAIDPGLGFSKTAEQTMEILGHIDQFHSLGYPIVLGASRKSFIGHITGQGEQKRDFATAAISAYAVMKGIQILRVHDVKATQDVIAMINAIQGVDYVRT